MTTAEAAAIRLFPGRTEQVTNLLCWFSSIGAVLSKVYPASTGDRIILQFVYQSKIAGWEMSINGLQYPLYADGAIKSQLDVEFLLPPLFRDETPFLIVDLMGFSSESPTPV